MQAISDFWVATSMPGSVGSSHEDEVGTAAPSHEEDSAFKVPLFRLVDGASLDIKGVSATVSTVELPREGR